MGNKLLILTWLLTILSLTATIANINKKRWCFGVWCFTNFAWCVYDSSIGAYAQSALFGAYTVLAIFGWRKWKKT